MKRNEAQSDVEKVVRKYVGDPLRRLKNIEIAGSGAFIGLFAALDIGLTGGLGTGFIALSSIVGGGSWLEYQLRKNGFEKTAIKSNQAGQTVKASNLVHMTLDSMQSKLQTAFHKASSPKASAKDKAAFQRLAGDIQKDVKTLSSVFSIASGGDTYEFVLAELIPAPHEKRLLTLAEVLNEPKKKSSEQEIADLKARLDAFENPKPLQLDKKPPPHKSGPTSRNDT